MFFDHLNIWPESSTMKLYRSKIGGSLLIIAPGSTQMLFMCLLLLLPFEPSFAQLKYTVDPLPGNWWDVNDDLNEQCERRCHMAKAVSQEAT